MIYEDGKPVRISNVVISTQHAADVKHEEIEKFIIEKIIRKVLPAELADRRTEFLINPTGHFVVGGPQGDTGLTGRKIIVDTYGGMGRHGGGAFSGKDPSKVDRSAAYMGRCVAKNIVAAGLADAVRNAVRLRHRPSRPGQRPCRHLRHRRASPTRRSSKAVNASLQLQARGHHQATQPAAGPSTRQTTNYGHFGKNDPAIHLGKDRQSSGAQERPRVK